MAVRPRVKRVIRPDSGLCAPFECGQDGTRLRTQDMDRGLGPAIRGVIFLGYLAGDGPQTDTLTDSGDLMLETKTSLFGIGTKPHVAISKKANSLQTSACTCRPP